MTFESPERAKPLTMKCSVSPLFGCQNLGTWTPKVVAALNDYRLELARLEGEFVWHSHDDTDEAFYVLAGEFELQLRDRVVPVRTGELVVVPRGLEHRPVAKSPCTVLLIEPARLVNTGGASDSPLTAPVDDWL